MVCVTIYGDSCSGKTTSVKTLDFEADGVVYMATNFKPLPFKEAREMMMVKDYKDIAKNINKGIDEGKKIFILDDFGTIPISQLMSRALETGYGKFTELGQKLFNFSEFLLQKQPNDAIVYIITHSMKAEEGRLMPRTPGRLFDRDRGLSEFSTCTFYSTFEDDEYIFYTQITDGAIAKSPEGMFGLKIKNDLKFIDTTIRNYYPQIFNKNNKEEQK